MVGQNQAFVFPRSSSIEMFMIVLARFIVFLLACILQATLLHNGARPVRGGRDLQSIDSSQLGAVEWNRHSWGLRLEGARLQYELHSFVTRW